MPTELRAAARGLRELIEAEADRVQETLGMTPPIVEAFVESGLFRLLVPRALGGFEADVDTILDVCEELSYADGSVGWAFAQNTSVLGYSAYLDPELALPYVGAAHLVFDERNYAEAVKKRLGLEPLPF